MLAGSSGHVCWITPQRRLGSDSRQPPAGAQHPHWEGEVLLQVLRHGQPRRQVLLQPGGEAVEDGGGGQRGQELQTLGRRQHADNHDEGRNRPSQSHLPR